MAWLMALWTGTRYATQTAGLPARRPGLAPALAGEALRLNLGLIFVIGSVFAFLSGMDADDTARTLGLGGLMVCAGVPFCAALSALTAWLTGRRLSGLA
jgi:hypothetical protein